MIKKSFVAVVTVFSIVISLFAGMHLVGLVKANPFFIFHQVDPVPRTIPPTITILSPQNNQVYYSDRIIISFNVSKPQLGACQTALIEVKYTLDDETVKAFTIWRGGSASNSWAIPEFDTVFTSALLSPGNHQLTVTTQGVVYPGNMSIFFISNVATAFFAVGNQSIELSPIPSQTYTYNPAVQLPASNSSPANNSPIQTSPPIKIGDTDSSKLSNLELIIAVIGVVCIFLVVGLLLKGNRTMKRLP